MTCDADLRKRFERARIESREIRVLSPNTFSGGFMETQPIENRIKHYFETIDWTSRADVSRLLPIINHALQRLYSHYHSELIHKCRQTFDRAGIHFDGVSLKKVPRKQT